MVKNMICEQIQELRGCGGTPEVVPLKPSPDGTEGLSALSTYTVV